jgi:hypothetical protein
MIGKFAVSATTAPYKLCVKTLCVYNLCACAASVGLGFCYVQLLGIHNKVTVQVSTDPISCAVTWKSLGLCPVECRLDEATQRVVQEATDPAPGASACYVIPPPRPLNCRTAALADTAYRL